MSNLTETPTTQKNVLACLTYLPVLFFLPLISGDNKDEVAKNSSQQSLTLLVAYILLNAIDMAMGFILPGFINVLFSMVLGAVQFVLAICVVIGMVRAYNNKAWKLPVVGDLDIMKKIKGE